MAAKRSMNPRADLGLNPVLDLGLNLGPVSPARPLRERSRSVVGVAAILLLAGLGPASLAQAAQDAPPPPVAEPADEPGFEPADPDTPDADAFSDERVGVKDRFTSMYELEAWSAYYYQRPEPERLAAFIRSSVEQGRVGTSVGLALCASFAREIVRQSPGMLDAWHADLEGASEVERWLLWNAIWWSGVDESKPFFQRIRDSVSERDRTEAIDVFIATDPGELRDEPIDRDLVARCMLEAFNASGDLAYIDRLIQEIDAPPLDVMRPTLRRGGFMMPAERIYRFIQDELVIYGHRHDIVHERLRASLEGLTAQGRPYMEEILARIDEKLAQEPSPDPSLGGPGLHADRLGEDAPAEPPPAAPAPPVNNDAR